MGLSRCNERTLRDSLTIVKFLIYLQLSLQFIQYLSNYLTDAGFKKKKIGNFTDQRGNK